MKDLPWLTPGVQRLVCSSGLFGPMGAFQHAFEGASVDQLRFTSYAGFCFFLRAVILWVLFLDGPVLWFPFVVGHVLDSIGSVCFSIMPVDS